MKSLQNLCYGAVGPMLAVLVAAFGWGQLLAQPARAPERAALPPGRSVVLTGPRDLFDRDQVKLFDKELADAAAAGTLLPAGRPERAALDAALARLLALEPASVLLRAKAWKWELALVDPGTAGPYALSGGKLVFSHAYLQRLGFGPDEQASILATLMATLLLDHPHQLHARRLLGNAIQTDLEETLPAIRQLAGPPVGSVMRDALRREQAFEADALARQLLERIGVPLAAQVRAIERDAAQAAGSGLAGERVRRLQALRPPAALAPVPGPTEPYDDALLAFKPAPAFDAEGALQFAKLVAQAEAGQALAPDDHPDRVVLDARLGRLAAMDLVKARLPRSAQWTWQVALVGSTSGYPFVMPGGKLVVQTGFMQALQPTPDELSSLLATLVARLVLDQTRELAAQGQALALAAAALGARPGADAAGVRAAANARIRGVKQRQVLAGDAWARQLLDEAGVPLEAQLTMISRSMARLPALAAGAQGDISDIPPLEDRLRAVRAAAR